MDECIAIGAALPTYEVLGNGLRLHFHALQSALIDPPKYQQKYQRDTFADTLAEQIIALLTESLALTQEELAESVKVSVPSVRRAMKILSNSGRIVRVGGKRYCRASDYYHWRCVSYVRLFSEKVKNSDR